MIKNTHKINEYLCKTNEEYNKKKYSEEKNQLFSSFLTIVDTWEMKSIAKTNGEAHKLVDK